MNEFITDPHEMLITEARWEMLPAARVERRMLRLLSALPVGVSQVSAQPGGRRRTSLNEPSVAGD